MLILTSPSFPFRLIEAPESESENLRIWKNTHRNSFFFKDEITPEMQAKWFAKYKADKHSLMLIVQEPAGDGWRSIGCMGYRILTEDADAPYLEPAPDPSGRPGYGYQWWLPAGRPGAVEAVGIFGQSIYDDPTKRLVIVRTSAWPAPIGSPEVYAEARAVREAIARKM